MQYQLLAGLSAVLDHATGAVIAFDPAHPGYQTYLAWVADGNVADPPPAPARPSVIQAGDFLARFTDVEQAAVQQAALVNPRIALGLTMGLARGWIDLQGPLLGPWMNALVAVGAITASRRAEIMTP